MFVRTIIRIALVLFVCSGSALGDENGASSENSIDVILARRVLVKEKCFQLRLTEEWVCKGHRRYQILELRKTELWPGEGKKAPETTVIWRSVMPYVKDSKRFSFHVYDVAVDSANRRVYLAMGSMQFQIFSFGIDSKPSADRPDRPGIADDEDWVEVADQDEVGDKRSFDLTRKQILPVRPEYIDRIMELDLSHYDDKLIMIAKVMDEGEEIRRFVWSISEERWLETAWTRNHGPTETLPGPVFDNPGGSSNTESGDGTGAEPEGKIEKHDIQSTE